MNKKALSPITIVFWYLTFLVVWFMFAGEKIRYWGLYAVEYNSLTGLEAFAYTNLNIIVLLMSFLFMLVIMAVGTD